MMFADLRRVSRNSRFSTAAISTSKPPWGGALWRCCRRWQRTSDYASSSAPMKAGRSRRRRAFAWGASRSSRLIRPKKHGGALPRGRRRARLRRAMVSVSARFHGWRNEYDHHSPQRHHGAMCPSRCKYYFL